MTRHHRKAEALNRFVPRYRMCNTSGDHSSRRLDYLLVYSTSYIQSEKTRRL